jgi:hypothetical protein
MKNKKPRRPLLEVFMDEYTGKAEARRVKEAANKPKARTVVEPHTRSVVPSMSSYRVQALENENHALRMQLAAQQNVNIRALASEVSEFEQAYNRPELEAETEPRGRKIVLD